MQTEAIALILCIVCGAFVHLGLRMLSHRNHNKMLAIVANYLVCAILGFSLSSDRSGHFVQELWFHSGLALGCFFVLIFWAMAYNAQLNGVSINALSNKLSLIIPIAAGLLFFNESIHWYGILGIAAAFGSIIIFSNKLREHQNLHNKIFPLLVFLGSGFVDLSLKFMSYHFSGVASMNEISFSIFCGAFLFGLLIVLFRTFQGKLRPDIKSIGMGALLGLPNYFSIALFLVAINAYDLSSAFVFGSQKTGIVVLSALGSTLLFKEKWNRNKFIALILAIIAVILIANEQF